MTQNIRTLSNWDKERIKQIKRVFKSIKATLCVADEKMRLGRTKNG